jgi:DNA invertase Pin-like site-specific DNA recombinase
MAPSAVNREIRRVAAYIRVSRKAQNPEMQAEDIGKYCAARGWEIVTTVTEKMSGAKRRPARQQLIAEAKAGAYDAIVSWKLDRWGRSTLDLHESVAELIEAGVGFATVRDNFDLTTATGRLVFSMLAAVAQFERELIVERVTTGLQHAQRHGTRSGKAIGRPATSAERAPRIASLVAQGVSLPEIAKRLEIPYSSVHRIARNK